MSMLALENADGSRLIPFDQWHPLDGVPPPEYIPPNWDGVHVGKRLIEAFATLARVRVARGPREYGTCWPLYEYDRGDLNAQAQAEPEAQLAMRAARNRTRLLPSALEIAQMEATIGWPAHYLWQRPIIMRIVQVVALLRSREREMDQIAKRLRRGPVAVRRVNRLGLDLIAAGLRLDCVPIF
jgi:hypothetical protein